METKFKETKKFKHIRTNTFDIPTGELEFPLTTGKEVFEFLMRHANKKRYQFKARGRGSRKLYGNTYDLPVEHAETIALYHSTREHISFKEHQERRRSKSAYEIQRALSSIKIAVEQHNQAYENDLEIEAKTWV